MAYRYKKNPTPMTWGLIGAGALGVGGLAWYFWPRPSTTTVEFEVPVAPPTQLEQARDVGETVLGWFPKLGTKVTDKLAQQNPPVYRPINSRPPTWGDGVDAGVLASCAGTPGLVAGAPSGVNTTYAPEPQQILPQAAPPVVFLQKQGWDWKKLALISGAGVGVWFVGKQYGWFQSEGGLHGVCPA